MAEVNIIVSIRELNRAVQSTQRRVESAQVGMAGV